MNERDEIASFASFSLGTRTYFVKRMHEFKCNFSELTSESGVNREAEQFAVIKVNKH